jgi:hypothetical protein
MQDKASRPSLKVLVAILFGLIIAFHLGSALSGNSLFRATHLGTALEYAHGPINLLRPIIVGFNATATPTALEFPAWQAAAALAFKAAGSTWYGWANIVSLLFFATALWPFFQIARHYAGERAAWWALVFFLSEPLIVLNAGEAATDGFSLVLIIWFLFFADRMIRTGKIGWWIPTALFGALSAVTKLPFFMTAGLCGVFLLLLNGARAWRPWLLLAAAGVFAAAFFAAWTHYTNSLAAQAEYPFEELRLADSPFMRWWYFGDLHSRLSPGLWLRGGWRFLHGTLGSLPLVLLPLASLARPGNRLAKFWLLAAAFTTLVFTHLVLEHWHYYLMCCPAVALLCGVTLDRWEPFLSQEIPARRLRLALAGAVVIFSAVDGIVTMKIAVNYDPYPKNVSRMIQEHTRTEDKLIVFDTGFFSWGGEPLFRSGRTGLSVAHLNTEPTDPNTKGLVQLLNNEADLNRLKSLGYDKLVLISESPVQFAAQASNPGYKGARFHYPATISPTVDAWPVVYQSDDLLIKDIR